jgi:hypothetical protein
LADFTREELGRTNNFASFSGRNEAEAANSEQKTSKEQFVKKGLTSKISVIQVVKWNTFSPTIDFN